MEAISQRTNLTNYMKVLLKLAVTSVIGWYIVSKLLQYPLSHLAEVQINFAVSLKIVSIVILFGLNWYLELYKWKILNKPVASIGFRDSLIQVTTGVSMGVITPYRLGEFAGRTMYHADKKQALALFAYSSAMQSITTLIFGFIGLLYWANVFFNVGIGVILCASALLIALSLILVLALPSLGQKLIVKLFRLKDGIALPLKNVLFTVLGLSLLRQVVFTTQFLFLLWVFAPNVPVIEAVMAISSGYLLSALIPSFTLLEVGNRIAMMVLIFDSFLSSYVFIPEVTILLWIINVGIPAFMGLMFLYRKPA